MRSISVRSLRSSLAATLSRVQSGERVVIVRHGKPVAELAPIGATDPRERKLSALAAEGILIRARRRWTPPHGFKGFPQLKGVNLAAQVLRDRR
jgi:prevent-host-death family protein